MRFTAAVKSKHTLWYGFLLLQSGLYLIAMNVLSKKRPLMAVLVLLLLAFAVSACGNKTDLTKPPATNVQVS